MPNKFTRRDIFRTGLAAIPALGFASAWGKGAPANTRFKLGIITDEISQDFEQALKLIAGFKLEYCELREVWDKNLVNAGKAELESARDLLARYKLKVSDVASPLFKYDLPEMPAGGKGDTFRADFTDRDTDSLLSKCFELGSFLGTRHIRVFSYWRVKEPEKAYPLVRERLAAAAEKAAKSGFVLLLENEPTCNVGTGKELGRMLREVNSPALAGNWDPANAVTLGETPYPDGYAAVRGLFRHMHAKDVKKVGGKFTWMPVGKGVVDWRGQLRALAADGYDGTLSLETHYLRPDGNKAESTRESLEGLLGILREI